MITQIVLLEIGGYFISISIVIKMLRLILKSSFKMKYCI